MVKETVVLGVLAFLLIWVSTSNFQGRFFSKKTFQGDFVNKTLLDNQIKRIKDELYERIRTESRFPQRPIKPTRGRRTP